MEDETTTGERTVPVIEEELVTGTRKVKTGSVRVHKTVQRVQKTVDIPTSRDVVDVTRKLVNQVVTTAPQVREEGDTLIIPVLEEEIVVTKRLILKEEIHIRRSHVTSHVSQDVSVGREMAVVERLDAAGNVVPSMGQSEPEQSEPRTIVTQPATTSPFLQQTEPLLREAPVVTPTHTTAVPLARPQKGLLD